jgi:hypothetical protein
LAYISKINKRNDYAFKRIFGHEDTKDILARFLTVMLGIQIEPEELTLIPSGKAAKSALDKASGNLLFWYDNKRVKAGRKSHLFYRNIG